MSVVSFAPPGAALFGGKEEDATGGRQASGTGGGANKAPVKQSTPGVQSGKALTRATPVRNTPGGTGGGASGSGTPKVQSTALRGALLLAEATKGENTPLSTTGDPLGVPTVPGGAQGSEITYNDPVLDATSEYFKNIPSNVSEAWVSKYPKEKKENAVETLKAGIKALYPNTVSGENDLVHTIPRLITDYHAVIEQLELARMQLGRLLEKTDPYPEKPTKESLGVVITDVSAVFKKLKDMVSELEETEKANRLSIAAHMTTIAELGSQTGNGASKNAALEAELLAVRSMIDGMTTDAAEREAKHTEAIQKFEGDLALAAATTAAGSAAAIAKHTELRSVEDQLATSMAFMAKYRLIFDKVIQLVYFLTERVNTGDIKDKRIEELYQLLHHGNGADKAVQIANKLIDVKVQGPRIDTLRTELKVVPRPGMKWSTTGITDEHDQFHNAYLQLVHDVSEIYNEHAKYPRDNVGELKNLMDALPA